MTCVQGKEGRERERKGRKGGGERWEVKEGKVEGKVVLMLLLVSLHLIREQHKVTRVALILAERRLPLLACPLVLRVPRRLVGHLRLHVFDRLELCQCLVHAIDRIVDEHIDEADEFGRVPREADHRRLVYRLLPHVFEDLRHLVPVLVLIVRACVRAAKLDVDEELHHRRR